jgi:thioredoxin 1
MSQIKEVNDMNFKTEVLESDKPVVVDFWAPWCGPCRMVAPVLDEISREIGDKIKFVKLNTDENQNTAAEFKIMAIPSLLIFHKGEEKDRVIGFKPKPQLIDQLNNLGFSLS